VQADIVELDTDLAFDQSPSETLDVLAQRQKHLLLGLVEVLPEVSQKLSLLCCKPLAEVVWVVAVVHHRLAENLDLVVLIVACGSMATAVHCCHCDPQYPR
jgi:hypothetical protein